MSERDERVEALRRVMEPAMGDDCTTDELRAYAARILASAWLRDLLAEAWDEGHRAGSIWDHTQHTDDTFSPGANPYRQEAR